MCMVITGQTVCKWVVSTALPEAIGKHFFEHSINGKSTDDMKVPRTLQ